MNEISGINRKLGALNEELSQAVRENEAHAKQLAQFTRILAYATIALLIATFGLCFVTLVGILLRL